MKYDIFFYEAFQEEQEELKKFLPENINAGFSWETIQETGHKRPQSKIISVRTQSKIPHKWADSLNGILTRSTGYDHVKRYRAETGVEVKAGYLPLYCNRSVAEQAALLWMSLLRKLPKQICQFDEFERDNITGSECMGKNIGIVGIGNIGYEVFKIAKGLGMNPLPVDVVKRYDDVEYTDIESVMNEADIICCCMNLNSTNKGFFDYDFFKKCKKRVVFVNVARGELSPQSGLFRLLQEGVISAVGMDVFDGESELAGLLRDTSPTENKEVEAAIKMSNLDNVIFTPHNAFNTMEAVVNKSEQSIQQLEHFLQNGDFLWPLPEKEIRDK